MTSEAIAADTQTITSPGFRLKDCRNDKSFQYI